MKFSKEAMLPNGTFEGKTVLITGGGTGLGLETAVGFARLGANLVIGSRNPEHLERARQELETEGAQVRVMPMDVRRPALVKEWVRAAVDEFSTIDVLVNNAAGNFLIPSKDLTPGGWKVVIDIALNGVFYCSREVGLHMIEKGGGTILNVVASYAWTGGPGTVHSAAAKAGVVAMTRTLAVEWARYGIRVNAVSPGILDTQGAGERLWPSEEARHNLQDAIPMKRFATSKEVADALLYLASPFAAYINGEVLVIDGAMHLNKGLAG